MLFIFPPSPLLNLKLKKKKKKNKTSYPKNSQDQKFHKPYRPSSTKEIEKQVNNDRLPNGSNILNTIILKEKLPKEDHEPPTYEFFCSSYQMKEFNTTTHSQVIKN